MLIRPYHPEDLPSLYEICLRTGDAGRDASTTCTHPRLLGDYFAAPYVVHDPALCLVLADAQGPCGYVLGTADSAGFFAWFNRDWLPRVRRDYGGLVPQPGATDVWLLEMLQRDEAPPPFAAEYPAHLHIDLLERAQGGGWGRRLFERWVELAAARGACGLHLYVAESNTGAQRFYERMGMRRLPEEGGCAFIMEIRPRA
jgi:ribosomal protein S18 acetylase RimI-like enzyme